MAVRHETDAGFASPRGLLQFPDFPDNGHQNGAVLSLCGFHQFQLAGQILAVGQSLAELTKARMMTMFIWMARLLRSTEESMATPSSVKA